MPLPPQVLLASIGGYPQRGGHDPVYAARAAIPEHTRIPSRAPLRSRPNRQRAPPRGRPAHGCETERMCHQAMQRTPTSVARSVVQITPGGCGPVVSSLPMRVTGPRLYYPTRCPGRPSIPNASIRSGLTAGSRKMNCSGSVTPLLAVDANAAAYPITADPDPDNVDHGLSHVDRPFRRMSITLGGRRSRAVLGSWV